jgi:hypothetical protein
MSSTPPHPLLLQLLNEHTWLPSMPMLVPLWQLVDCASTALRSARISSFWAIANHKAEELVIYQGVAWSIDHLG